MAASMKWQASIKRGESENGSVAASGISIMAINVANGIKRKSSDVGILFISEKRK